jgi:DNA polymerase-3 subunit gamma/tau
MGQALYRKYRSKKLSELIGQEHVTKALATALKDNHVSHAYLFTGPRGVGKTSVARIVAHEINGLPYTDDSTHLDIIEIDAASNRRIDEIRELRERVNIAPSSARYKVYIIDEVHMLTKEAFNALLKTLEEPPAHVVFILATTEAYKLPETIISRTQRFAFRPVALDDVVKHLRSIAQKEKINISDEALVLIAAHGEGSIRDSISLLDQIRNTSETVDLSDVQSMLGLAPDEIVKNLIDQVENCNAAGIVDSLRQMHEQGYEAAMIAKQLGQTWRINLLEKRHKLPSSTVLELLKNLLAISASQTPFALLEITLLKSAADNTPDEPPVVAKTNEPVSPSGVPKAPVLEVARPSAQSEDSPKKSKPVTDPPVKRVAEISKQQDPAVWTQVLDAVKQDHNTLYGVARMADPRFDGNHLILTLQFPFHYKRLEESRNKQVLLKILQEITGQAMTITCELSPDKPSSVKTDKPVDMHTVINEPVDNEQLQAISNIFGGGELLQSED